jgi:heat shock protein HtpX
LTLLLLWGGQALAGPQGMTIALVLAGIMNFVGYFFSDKIALAMHGAKELTAESGGDLYWRLRGMMDKLCARANLPVPRLYVIPSDSPNAFATGRNPKHAAVAVTEGALRLFDQEELEGVLAHELGHVRNRDILIASLAAMLAGAITHLSYMARWAMIFGGGRRDDDDRGGGGLEMLAMLILAPIAALLIQMAVSRQREYGADRAAAEFTGNPYGLARALEKLENWSKRIPLETSPAAAHMFIINPLSGGGFLELFSTHPPTHKRIAALLGRAA